MTTITTTTNTLAFQQQNEEAVKQFIMDTLDRNELPDGSLQDILKDGILLCDLIKRFSPNESIFKNEGRTKFAYQDNIGQFLRVAESLHIPQSDLFQTVDLLEGKRMQSVISCLLAIKRIMCERKVIPKHNSLTATKKNGSTRNLLLLVDDNNNNTTAKTAAYKRKSSSNNVLQISNKSSPIVELNKKPTTTNYFLTKNNATSYIPAFNNHKTKTAAITTTKTPTSTTTEIIGWPKKLSNHHHHRRVEPEISKKKLFNTTAERTKKSIIPTGGYVKSQVQMITTSNNNQLNVIEPPVRRLSSDTTTSKEERIQEIKKSSSPVLKQQKILQLPPLPKPSKSTPLAATATSSSTSSSASKKKTASSADYKKSSACYNNECSNRKTSLKKMGSCAITIESDDGSLAVYALGKSIGKGQFGEVFGGLNMDTGEYVAIKRIKRNQMDCDDMNEVGVLKHLNNEHIVRYVGFSKDKEYLNIILEYVEMGSLHNNIKAFGKFPEKLAASYTYKILSGLHYLHSKDVIHCDLKAANILTTKTGSLKLTDFGVSLSLKMKDDENTGEPAGTPNWMAPEVIKFAGASAKSDIWSLGCTIVEMLTGKPPYAGMPSFAALYRIVEDDEPPIPKNIKLSEEATEFLLACFKKNPQDRPSAYDLMKSKWMEPYFNQDEFLLSPPSSQQRTVKKSKSETCLELSDSETLSDSNDFLTHEFIDYQTYQNGEKCCECGIQMKRLWVKSCQDCHMYFHPHCINRAPLCTKGYSIPQNIIKPSSSSSSNSSNSDESNTKKPSSNSRYTPLGPLNGVASDIKKIYLPVLQQQQHYRSEGYSQNKSNNNSARRNIISSIMT